MPGPHDAKYERLPTTLEDGRPRPQPSTANSVVTCFSNHSYRLTTAFIAFCILCAFLPLSTALARLGWDTRAGLAPEQQLDRTMDNTRCRAEFPALFPQLDANVKAWKQKGGIKKHDVDMAQQGANRGWGTARVVIKNRQLYIREVKEGNESRISALLHLLHTAVATDPASSRSGGNKPLPPIDLVISSADKDGNSNAAAWAIDKRVDEDPSVGRWLLPDFGFAGWPEAGIASFEEYIRLVQKEEREYPWENKDDHAFWRGLANWYTIRKDLLNRTSVDLDPSRKEWADVRQTSFHDKGDQFAPIVPMHEHCRRKYLIQSEGNSYSGRFKYLLACHSVTIAHPLEWTQHFHPALVSDPASRQQNFVELKGPLFEGLEEEVRRLQDVDRGRRSGGSGRNAPRTIADNAQRTLKERYLTPAATMCYTRAALQAYASVLERPSWGQDPMDLEEGPFPQVGGGVVASGGRGKDLAQLGAKGDIEYGVWRLSGSIDWPPHRSA
ncbi:hypothetical protein ACQY0O_002269 [Thecaphora frezii]